MKSKLFIIGAVVCGLIAACEKHSTSPVVEQPQAKPAPIDPRKGKTQLTESDIDHFDPDTVKAKKQSPVVFELHSEGLPKTGNWKSDPVVADVNADGKLDIAALSRLGEGPQVWLGDGGKTWTNSSHGLQYGTQCCGGGLAFGDINHDGKLDLAIGDHCHGGWIYFGDGKGNWELVAKELYPYELSGGADRDSYLGTEDIDLADFNKDGELDLIMIATEEGGINVFTGNGKGTPESWKWLDCGLPKKDWGTRAGFLDVNKDGNLDVVASMFNGPRVWLGDGEGHLQPDSTGLPAPIYGGFYHSFAMGDFNEDGLPDLVFGNWSDGAEVFLQQRDNTWKQAPRVFEQMHGGAYGVDAGDIDGDGHLDLVVSGRLPRDVGFIYGVFLLLGDGKGGFTWVDENNLPKTGMASNYGVKLVDLNGDKRLDVVVASGGMVGSASSKSAPPSPRLPEKLLVWMNRAR